MLCLIFCGNHDDLLFFWNYQNNLFKTWNFYNNINVLIICFHQFLLTLNFLIVVYVIFKYFYLAVSFCAYVTNSSAEGEFLFIFGNRLMMNCTGISCNECCSCYFLFLVFLFVNYFWILVECVLGQGQWLVTAHVFVLGLANDAHTDCSVCRWIENFRSMLLLSSVCV